MPKESISSKLSNAKKTLETETLKKDLGKKLDTTQIEYAHFILSTLLAQTKIIDSFLDICKMSKNVSINNNFKVESKGLEITEETLSYAVLIIYEHLLSTNIVSKILEVKLTYNNSETKFQTDEMIDTYRLRLSTREL